MLNALRKTQLRAAPKFKVVHGCENIRRSGNGVIIPPNMVFLRDEGDLEVYKCRNCGIETKVDLFYE